MVHPTRNLTQLRSKFNTEGLERLCFLNMCVEWQAPLEPGEEDVRWHKCIEIIENNNVQVANSFLANLFIVEMFLFNVLFSVLSAMCQTDPLNHFYYPNILKGFLNFRTCSLEGRWSIIFSKWNIFIPNLCLHVIYWITYLLNVTMNLIKLRATDAMRVGSFFR